MLQKTIHAFDFLNVPLEKEPYTVAEKIVRRFGHTDYHPGRVKVKDLAMDTDIQQTLATINAHLSAPETASSVSTSLLGQWTTQTRRLHELWRAAAQTLLDAEKTLKASCDAFNDAYKKANCLLELPASRHSQESYESLLKAAESYIDTLFQETSIEQTFRTYCEALKQVVVLSDAMSATRVWLNSPTEPMCIVCMTEPVTTALVPCGHTFCGPCGQKQGISCFLCRVAIKDKLKVFFS